MKKKQLNALCLLIVATCYIYNTKAAQCDPFTGPSGARQCVKISGYNDYQWATCRTDSYIRAKTLGIHLCQNIVDTYCLYQCMVAMYGANGGDVYGSCRCSPNSASQKEKYTLVFFVLVAISSLLVS